MAMGALVMSIIGITTGGVFAPVGVIFGHIARHQIKRTGESGAQLARWGLILGYIGCGLIVFWVAHFLFFVVYLGVGLSPGR